MPSDTLPDMAPGYDDDDTPVVILEDDSTHASLAALLAAAPALRDPANAATAAIAVNHLFHGVAYKVIEDPDAYRAWFDKRVASENPDAPFRQDTPALTNFETPDLDRIKAPAIDGTLLTYCATRRGLGMPYSASIDLSTPDDPPVYSAL